MSTDTPPTIDPRVSRVLAELVAAHNDGGHRDRPRTGCPSCVFSGRVRE